MFYTPNFPAPGISRVQQNLWETGLPMLVLLTPHIHFEMPYLQSVLRTHTPWLYFPESTIRWALSVSLIRTSSWIWRCVSSYVMPLTVTLWRCYVHSIIFLHLSFLSLLFPMHSLILLLSCSSSLSNFQWMFWQLLLFAPTRNFCTKILFYLNHTKVFW